MHENELIIDNFAGGGGATAGIEQALGRHVDVAINHDPEAISMHTVNHPNTKHYCENIWEVDPVDVANGRPVGLAWFSPDCTHFSKAKGGRPVKKNIRGLAWVVIRWAAKVRPRVIMLENVEEFQDWGPLDKRNKPKKTKKGETFNQWKSNLEDLGYQVEYKLIKACDYGAPTIRRRLFLIARCDGLPIQWPEPTHGQGLETYRTAASILDFDIPCPSIFARKKPLAENTLKRIARGLQRFVFDNPKPFIVRIGQTKWNGTGMQYSIDDRLTTITSKAEHCLVTAFMAKHFGGVTGCKVDTPLPTILSKGYQTQLVTSHLMKMRNNGIGQRNDEPLHTITSGGNHFAEVRAFLLKYYGTNVGLPCNQPLHTVTSKHRFGLVTIHGEDYQITDIGMRMLQPRELYNAQGFPPDYIIDRGADGKRIIKTSQVRMCGNSVSPNCARAIVAANLKGADIYLSAQGEK